MQDSVPLDYSALPQTVLLPREGTAALTAQASLPQQLEAPVEKGQTLGTVQVYHGETLLGEYEGGVKSAVRTADDYVRLHGVLQREVMPGTQPGTMHACSLNDRIRTREVDELEHAHGAFLTAVGLNALDTVVVDHNDLARFDIPDEFRADTIQRAAFGGNDIACVLRQFAQAQRTESLWIPCCDELFRGHYREGIRPFYLIHRLFNSLLNGACFQACLGNCVGNDLGIAGAVEYRAL